MEALQLFPFKRYAITRTIVEMEVTKSTVASTHGAILRARKINFADGTAISTLT